VLSERLALYEEQLRHIDAAFSQCSQEDAVALSKVKTELADLVTLTKELVKFQQENGDLQAPAEEAPPVTEDEEARPDEDLVEIDIIPEGSSVQARWHDGSWRPAAVDTWRINDDATDVLYRVTFIDPGIQSELGIDDIQPMTEAVDDSNDEEDEKELQASTSTRVTEEQCTSSYGSRSGDLSAPTLYSWDTKGVASKLMQAMGYRPGQGLGREGNEGRAAALEVHAPLRKGTTLDGIEGAKRLLVAGGSTSDTKNVIGVEKWENGRRRVVLKHVFKGDARRLQPQQRELREKAKGGPSQPKDDMFDFLNASLNSKVNDSSKDRAKRVAQRSEEVNQIDSKEEFRKRILHNREDQDRMRKKIADLEASVARAKKNRDPKSEKTFTSQRDAVVQVLSDSIREGQRLEEKMREKEEGRKLKKGKFEF